MKDIGQNNKLPNFLIVGAAKAGTTSLYHYLKQHPDVFMPEKKEPKYFSSCFLKFPLEGVGDNEMVEKKIVKKIDDYIDLFSDAQKEIAIGEASADNLYYHNRVIPKIKDILGDLKIIIILRNPVERAYSSYLHLVRDQREKLSFDKALKKEEERIKDNWEFIWHYKNASLYFKQVKMYLENFSKVKVYLFEDLINNKKLIIENMYEFLGVNRMFYPRIDNTYNKSGVPKNNIINKTLKNPPKILVSMSKIIPSGIREGIILNINNRNLKKPKMKKETRNYLKTYFKKDIIKLEKLINRDLSFWLK